MTDTLVGIDYSISSPAVTVYKKDNSTGEKWSVNNCDFYFFLPEKNKNHSIITKMDSSSSLCCSPHFYPLMYPDLITGFDRYIYLADWVVRCLSHYKITGIALEGYAYASRASSVFPLAENVGILKYKLKKEMGIEPEIIPPSKVKKFASGRGNANKEVLNECFKEETGIDIKQNLLEQSSKSYTPSSDIIDSYYIAKWLFFSKNKTQQ